MAALKWLVLVSLLVACVMPARLPKSYDAVPMKPPLRYLEHWQAMEQCTGRFKSFYDVKWFVAFGNLRLESGLWMGGRAYPVRKWIVMRASFVDVDYLVQHEIIHILMPEVKNHVVPFGVCAPKYVF